MMELKRSMLKHEGMEMDNNLALSSMETDSFFWFGLLSFSELTDKVSQSATQLLYREITLSKCGVACTLLPVQKDAI